MIKRVLRIALTSLALFMAISGSMNLNRAGASEVAPGGGLCDGICGCAGGPTQCCTWNGVTCYTRAATPIGD